MLTLLAIALTSSAKLDHNHVGVIENLKINARMLPVIMTEKKPDHVTREPKYENAPLYYTLSFGDKPKPVVAVLDEGDKNAILYLDTNANGDLTDDPKTNMHFRNITPPEKRKPPLKIYEDYWFKGDVTAFYNDGRQERLGVQFRIYSKMDRLREKIEPTLIYWRDYYRQGPVTLDGKAYQVALIDNNTDGRYDSKPDEKAYFKGDVLYIDADGSGKFEPGTESFLMHEPFNIGGVTYEVAKISPDGSTIEFKVSEKTVAPRVAPKRLKVDEIAPDFEVPESGPRSGVKAKLVLIDFWATWCGPCIAELPEVRKVYKAFKNRGFEIVGVSLDAAGDKAKMEQFVKQNDMPWLQVHDGDRAISKKYFVTSIPMTFLVDASGKIVATDLRGEELYKEVERRLAN